ncbi:phosphoenolpyruvate synthase [Candidatus Roizmanbacteria bacterium]|nr:phosphoenolpyruvate synthase [Candidatus Roizmanbacteria bacterium]
MNKKNIVWFEEVGKEDVGIVGGKGANLGEMTTAHLPIPYGFVVTAHAYFTFIEEAKLSQKISDLLSIVNYDNTDELEKVSGAIRKLIIEAPMPKKLAEQIVEYYEDLQAKEQLYLHRKIHPIQKSIAKIKAVYDPPLVAVRSSATAEDLPTASFAGQQETYLNVKGETQLLKKVKECWASLFTERAVYYRHTQGFDHFKVGLAAVVQRMVQSTASGIAFSIDPVTNNKTKIVIEAIFGLGEYIVQGKVTPDHYEVDKRSIIILEKQLKYQNLKYVRHGTGNMEVKLNKKEGSLQKISDEQIMKLTMLVKDIENHYYFPQDIEWAIEHNNVFIVQSRPITTVDNKAGAGSSLQSHTTALPILSGSPASPGIGVGPAKIIFSPHEIDKIEKGDILVAPQTNPDYVPAMKKACAIVTEKGGRTSHAAIVSRELGIPAVVGAENATKILKNGETYSIDGASGEVFAGSILIGKAKVVEEEKPALKTVTKVYVNVAEPEQAARVAKTANDGIGLLRAEFMIAEIGVHPKEFIHQKKEQLFTNRLKRDLLTFVKAFTPRQIVYRATDFKSNEYSHLVGGKKYEPHEENPMLGFRGASRYLANEDVFGLELEAIKAVWAEGYRNLHLMIPFVRTPWELIKIKEIIAKHELDTLQGFKLWIMVEVPSCALNIEEYIKIGIDGVSIGTNDLTMMLLGVDRDSEKVANVYDERSPVVVNVLEHVVKTCAKYGVTCSICGQAASDYPELVEKLVRAGITSVSVAPDAVDRTRELIYSIEKKMNP